MSEISPELVERMVKFVRFVKGYSPNTCEGHAQAMYRRFVSDAAAINADLPRPVDPDLVEAREVVCGYHHDKHPESPWHVEQAEIVRSGRFDQMLDVQAAYFGIKRGRELERGQ